MTRKQYEIGLHHVEIDGDVILSRWFGVCSLQQLEQFFAILNPMLESVRHPFLLIDNTHAAPGLPEVRRRLFEWARTHRVGGGVVIFGATAATRVIGLLVLHAISLFKSAEYSKRITILPDENSARLWMSTRRADLQAESATTGPG